MPFVRFHHVNHRFVRAIPAKFINTPDAANDPQGHTEPHNYQSPHHGSSGHGDSASDAADWATDNNE